MRKHGGRVDLSGSQIYPAGHPHVHVTGSASTALPRREGTKVEGKDVMISYSHQDQTIMRNIKGVLESSGLSVWVDETELSPGSPYLREIGEAIVDSSVFLTLLSRDSVQSKYCQDETSLAYISNKTIFAISITPYDELTEVMDLGMKLTLSTVQWHFITGSADESKLKPLLESIKTALSSKKESDLEEIEGDLAEENTNFVINKQAFRFRNTLISRELSVEEQQDLGNEPFDLSDKEFWGANFGKETLVEWTKFVQVLNSTYGKLWKQLMVSDLQKQLLLDLMSKEMAVKNGIVTFVEFKKFCTRGREVLPLSQSIRLYAAQTYAMKGVFDVNSSVRLSAIANLKKYQSRAVIDSLLDILEGEEDPDVKVVAAMSLAHAASGIKVFKVRAQEGLMLCLNHPDRLVRESGCLALGRLKSKKSVPKLVQIWRNDYISTVREAAQIAINQIGGDDAEQAMHVTKLLTEEISLLKQSPH